MKNSMEENWDKRSTVWTNPVPLTDAMVMAAEKKLGVRLPQSYVDVLRTRNGGRPLRNRFPLVEQPESPEDFLTIEGVCGLGGKWGIDSDELGTQFFIDNWGYPACGIIVAHGISAGHDAVMLDFSKSGSEGEPSVISVDVEGGLKPRIRPLASCFEEFWDKLCITESVDDSADELRIVQTGAFTAQLTELLAKSASLKVSAQALRSLAARIVVEKQSFSLHDDPLSYLTYDVLFLLYTNANPAVSKRDFLKAFPALVVAGAPFSTGGYSKTVLEKWFDSRVKDGKIVISGQATADSASFSDAWRSTVLQSLNEPSMLETPTKKKKRGRT